MNITLNPKMYFLIAAGMGAVISYVALSLTSDDTAHYQQITQLENRILDLELLLAQKEDALKNTHFIQLGTFEPEKATPLATSMKTVTQMQPQHSEQPSNYVETSTPDTHQILKDLATLAYGDPRSFPEKVSDFLAENPGKNNVAIVSKSVYDLAENHDVLTDQSLESIYIAQTDQDLKRVVAQVASLRGDNSLIEMQIAETRAGLKSTSSTDRQKALVELAKTRYVGAANVVVPLLDDNDIGVKLDALLALRATGNQSHVRFVQHLVNHPNESVSWLAKDVVNNLQILSDMARTKLASNDIVAELPPIAAPL